MKGGGVQQAPVRNAKRSPNGFVLAKRQYCSCGHTAPLGAIWRTKDACCTNKGSKSVVFALISQKQVNKKGDGLMPTPVKARFNQPPKIEPADAAAEAIISGLVERYPRLARVRTVSRQGVVNYSISLMSTGSVAAGIDGRPVSTWRFYSDLKAFFRAEFPGGQYVKASLLE